MWLVLASHSVISNLEGESINSPEQTPFPRNIIFPGNNQSMWDPQQSKSLRIGSLKVTVAMSCHHRQSKYCKCVLSCAQECPAHNAASQQNKKGQATCLRVLMDKFQACKGIKAVAGIGPKLGLICLGDSAELLQKEANNNTFKIRTCLFLKGHTQKCWGVR